MSLHSEIFLALDNLGFTMPKNTKGITRQSLVEFIASRTSTSSGGLGYTSAGGINKFLRKAFPSKFVDARYIRTSYITFLLDTIGKKLCNRCNKVYPVTAFHVNSSTATGLSTYCAECQKSARKDYYSNNKEKELSANSVRDGRLKEFQTPSWSELAEIKRFYLNCPDGCHVDHILPLNGRLVSGLHVLNNLQYLSSIDNLSKGNKYVP